ncbi:hypothetical protein J2X67_004794 [Variovorax sp. 3319]|nr:hypothetical protein [Variovorax sp. 3319]
MRKRAAGGRRFLTLLPPLALLAASAPCLASWSIEDARSTAEIHGLYEIREEARRFVARENATGQGDWIALDPNLKILVARCAVPLKTQWTPRSYGMTGRNVMVSCAQVALPHKPWNVHVPVGRTSPRPPASR